MFALVLTCLVCAGHGRRVHLTFRPIKDLDADQNSQRTGSILPSHHSLANLERTVANRFLGEYNALRELAHLLLAISPPAAFNPSSVHSLQGSSRARSQVAGNGYEFAGNSPATAIRPRDLLTLASRASQAAPTARMMQKTLSPGLESARTSLQRSLDIQMAPSKKKKKKGGGKKNKKKEFEEEKEKDELELLGTVTEAKPGGTFEVQLDDANNRIVCHTAGKIKRSNIKILAGDRVTVEISPYDLTKGRITFRESTNRFAIQEEEEEEEDDYFAEEEEEEEEAEEDMNPLFADEFKDVKDKE